MHGLRHPVLQPRLPAGQHHPGLERPGVPGPLGGGDRTSPRHQQLPRLHRTPLPGAVRGRLRPRHQPGPGDDQAGRVHDHRQRLEERLGPPRASQPLHRQEGRRHRLRTGRPRRGPAAHPGRPPGDRLRTCRPHRRPAPLRHPRVQAREAPPRPASGPDARRGHRVPHPGRRRSGPAGRQAPLRPRRRRHRHRIDRGPRPADPRAGAVGDPSGHGVPAVVQPRPGGRPRTRGRPDPRRRPQGRDHRRRRHRRRLPGHRPPPGRGEHPPVRDHGPAARVASRRQPVADLAVHLPHQLRPRGGRRAGVRHQHPRVRRRRLGSGARPEGGRRRAGDGGRATVVRPGRRVRTRDRRRPGAPGDGLHRSRTGRAHRRTRRRARRPRQRRPRRRLGHQHPRRLRLRGRRPGPEPDRVGDRRGPLLRGGGRPAPDG